MGILSRIRKLLRSGEPAPETVFGAAYRHGTLLHLRFVDKDRIAHDLDCHIRGIKNGKIFLVLVHSQPADLFNGEKCLAHFKLSPSIMKKELGISRDPSQNAFLCKSGIIFHDSDVDGQTWIVGIRMPRLLIRREWRLYPRVNVSGEMIPSAGIILNSPQSARNEKDEDTGAEPANASRFFAARLINISEGGAKLALEHVDFLDEFLNLDKSRPILRLTLPSGGNMTLVSIPCECVSSSYSIKMRKLALHLRYLDQEGEDSKKALQENDLKDDLNVLRNWLGEYLH